MTINKEYANIYLVSGIITVLTIFSIVSFIIITDDILNGSSAQIAKELSVKDK
ncbi:hypothetical protein ACKGJI_03440 [Sulfurospirillum sp. 1307]|jgi:hypothetical protein